MTIAGNGHTSQSNQASLMPTPPSEKLHEKGQATSNISPCLHARCSVSQSGCSVKRSHSGSHASVKSWSQLTKLLMLPEGELLPKQREVVEAFISIFMAPGHILHISFLNGMEDG